MFKIDWFYVCAYTLAFVLIITIGVVIGMVIGYAVDSSQLEIPNDTPVFFPYCN